MAKPNTALTVLLILLCLLITPTANAAPNPGSNPDAEEADYFELSLVETPVAQAFEMLSSLGQISIILSNDVSGSVTASIYGNSLEDAVRTVADAAGFAVEKRGDTFFVMQREQVGTERVSDLTDVQSFRLQYLSVVEAAPLVESYLSRYGKLSSLPERKTLVVTDQPDFLARIGKVLAEIDREPKQILIEAEILEVALTDDETFGIDWTGRGGKGTFGSSGLTGNVGSGFFMEYLTRDLDIYLDALSQSGRVRTLSTPKLLVLEDEDAEVIIGDRIGYRVTTTIDSVTSESVEFIESGVILRVRAAVDNKDRIMLEVHPEVSSGTVTDGIPTVSTTEVTTHLIADDGQPLFIGGLIKNSKVDRESGVPGLRSVPVLGALFSQNEDRFARSETVVMMRPHLVNGHKTPALEQAVERSEMLSQGLKSEGPGTLVAQDLGNGFQGDKDADPDKQRFDEAIRGEGKPEKPARRGGVGWLLSALVLILLI